VKDTYENVTGLTYGTRGHLEITKLLKRIEYLEQGFKTMIAASHAFVLTKHGARDASVHEMYRRMAQKVLRTNEV